MKKLSSWLWGAVLIIVGVLWALKATGVITANLFFPGWWTLFIVIPSLIGLITEDSKGGSFVSLVIGVCLMLVCWEVLDFDLFWKLFLPVVLIMIGLSMIFHAATSGAARKRMKELHLDENKLKEFWATFGDQKVSFYNKDFEGCQVDAVFGGADLDLRGAKIKKDVILRACSVFGGIKIFVPDDVKVEIVSTSIFGGVSDERKQVEKSDSKVADNTLFIEATCLFGGVKIQ